MKKNKKIIISLISFILVGYLVSPYWSLILLKKALDSGDREKLSDKIDFPSVRLHLKEDLKAIMISEMSKDDEISENPFGGVALMFAPVLIDSMIDNYVTPAAISTVVKKGRLEIEDSQNKNTAKNQDEESDEKDPALKWAFFSSPTIFRAEFKNEVVLRFELQGFTWKLTRIIIPLEQNKQAVDD